MSGMSMREKVTFDLIVVDILSQYLPSIIGPTRHKPRTLSKTGSGPSKQTKQNICLQSISLYLFPLFVQYALDCLETR